jgi:hypothetical protein
MQLMVELSEMPFPVSPFTKPGRPGEIVGRRAYASVSQGGDHEDRSYHRRVSCDSH